MSLLRINLMCLLCLALISCGQNRSSDEQELSVEGSAIGRPNIANDKQPYVNPSIRSYDPIDDPQSKLYQATLEVQQIPTNSESSDLKTFDVKLTLPAIKPVASQNGTPANGTPSRPNVKTGESPPSSTTPASDNQALVIHYTGTVHDDGRISYQPKIDHPNDASIASLPTAPILEGYCYNSQSEDGETTPVSPKNPLSCESVNTFVKISNSSPHPGVQYDRPTMFAFTMSDMSNSKPQSAKPPSPIEKQAKGDPKLRSPPQMTPQTTPPTTPKDIPPNSDPQKKGPPMAPSKGQPRHPIKDRDGSTVGEEDNSDDEPLDIYPVGYSPPLVSEGKPTEDRSYKDGGEVPNPDLPFNYTNYSKFSETERNQSLHFYSTYKGVEGKLQNATELPISGNHYLVKDDSMRFRYGAERTVKIITELIDKYIKKNSERTKQNPNDFFIWYDHKIVIGDLSAKTGGAMSKFGKNHSSHQNGLDFDIGYLLKNYSKQPTSFVPDQSDPTYLFQKKNLDTKNTLQLMNLITRTGMVYAIFIRKEIKKLLCSAFDEIKADFSKQIKTDASSNIDLEPVNQKITESIKSYEKTLSLLYPDKIPQKTKTNAYQHYNHFHVRLKCPPLSPGCKIANEIPNTGTGCEK